MGCVGFRRPECARFNRPTECAKRREGLYGRLEERMNRIAAGGANQGWWTRERLMTAALFILTVLLLYGCFLVARPFVTALTWAIALAVAAFPLHRWIS